MILNDENKIKSYFLVIRNGVPYAELTAIGTPVIRMNSDAEIKTAFSGEFLYDEKINLLSDVIRPILTINDADYVCGEFVVTTAKNSYKNGQHSVSVESYDNSYLLKRTRIETNLFFPTGTLYSAILLSLFSAAGLEKITTAETDAVLQTDREWITGTNCLAIANELLSEINYKPIFTDNNGNICIEPKTKKRDTITYNSGEISIIKSDATSSNDIFGKCNVFMFSCTNPELPQPLFAVSENNSPTCAFSTVNIGRVAAELITVNNIAGADELQVYADDYKLQSMLSAETVTFTTAVNPEHGIYNSLVLNHEFLSGIFNETEWQLPVGVGNMTHTARRVLL